ncbi:MerR family transcriptional regulator [Nostoc sp. NIES-4103]|nr:MerR family transcriptional regulator [Nostoc sp. NIES-4103]
MLTQEVVNTLTPKQPKLIGTVAKESGVPIKTIRYYEELGLVKSLGRTEGGFRLFDADVLTRLHFIKRAQSLGLSLAEIKEFLQVHDQGELPCEHIKIQLENRVKSIDEQIQQLLILKQDLEAILSDWSVKTESDNSTICPIIE